MTWGTFLLFYTLGIVAPRQVERREITEFYPRLSRFSDEECWNLFRFRAYDIPALVHVLGIRSILSQNRGRYTQWRKHSHFAAEIEVSKSRRGRITSYGEGVPRMGNLSSEDVGTEHGIVVWATHFERAASVIRANTGMQKKSIFLFQ
ncbi:unnamed protein product, partial [Discosporangium mesarthrocarpum]